MLKNSPKSEFFKVLNSKLFSIQSNQPLWLTLNSNFIAEELVRTLVGSLALMLAVPITTALAAYWYSRTTFVLQEQ